MKLQLANGLQHHIADLMWKAKDREEVKDLIVFYGIDAVIVLNMMLADYYDKVNDTDLAEEVINRIK